ncbi:MAG: TlpA disulfide reductase family protein [Bacteroidota bacterium]
MTKQAKLLKLTLNLLLLCTTASCQVNSDSSNSEIKIIENYDKIVHLSEILTMKEFENKVIYIDIWGTGCSPCIAESKYLPELKKRYKNKDVVFLYLAKPYGLFRISKWKKEIQQYNLEGYHIYMSEELKDNIMMEVPGIRQIGIPKYLLVNKQGKVAYPDAPRPSSEKDLYKLIDQLLDE